MFTARLSKRYWHEAPLAKGSNRLSLADLSPLSILLVAIGAAGIGFSKSGFAGVSMVHVVVFAAVFGARNSTGVLLPMLIIGDLLAVKLFGAQVQWPYFRKLLPPSFIGVVIGWWLLDKLDERSVRPLIGAIIMVFAGLQSLRIWRPKLFEQVPHARWFAWTLGLLTGITTMLANAAGPLVALYMIAVSLPKFQLIGTSAWFFLVLNTFKIPFSANLGLIDWNTLAINATFAPVVGLGMLAGRSLVHRLPQKAFDTTLLVITAAAAVRLLLS